MVILIRIIVNFITFLSHRISSKLVSFSFSETKQIKDFLLKYRNEGKNKMTDFINLIIIHIVVSDTHVEKKNLIFIPSDGYIL